jgi:hypothetical protein
MQDKMIFVELNNIKTLDGLMYTKVTKVNVLKEKNIYLNYFVSVCAKCEVKHCFYTEKGAQQRNLAV